MMFINTLKAEKIKLKNSPIWIAFFIIPCISAFMGTFNYLGNLEVLQSKWYSLWTQHTLFYCYFCFQALIGVYCAYECRLEHMEHNWNTVLTMPIKRKYIFISKLITVFKIVLITQVLAGILFYISGKIAGLSVPFDMRFILLLILGSIGSLPIISLQLMLSLKIKSFAIPIGISMLGGALSVAAYAKGVSLFFPYALFPLGMCTNYPQEIQFSIISYIISCLIFTVLFTLLGINIIGEEK